MTSAITSGRRLAYVNKVLLVTVLLVIVVGFFWAYRLPLFFSDRYDWYIYLSARYSLIGDYKTSLDYANLALRMDQKRAGAHIKLVENFFSGGDYALAENELNNWKRLDNSILPIYYHRLGVIRLRQGLLNESKIYFEKGISENHLVPHNYIGMGLLNLRSKNLDLSLKYFNTSLQLLDAPFYEHYDSSYRLMFENHEIFYRAEIHAAMAQAYSEKGLEDKALREQKIALSICPCAEYVLQADLN